MAKKRPTPATTPDPPPEPGQVFYEFPGAVPLGLTVTELPALTMPRFGGLTGIRVTRFITRLMLWLAAVLLATTTAGGAVLAYYWIQTPKVPPLAALVNKQFSGATIYDRNGEVLYNIGYGAAHRTVKLDEVPEPIIQATIAAEDANFYSHKGVDLAGIARAAWADARHQEAVQGGSTITQQLVKNTILNGDKSFDRKLKEAVMATKVEQRYSKDDILSIYLNQIFYGQRSWGVADAAHNYFAKDVQDLTLAEAAMLAGIPNAPTLYSPLGAYPEFAESRQNYVLGRMTDLGYVTPDQAKAAATQELAYQPPKSELRAPHFVSYVRDLLAKDYSTEEIEHGGFRIYTTLDLKKQETAERLVREQVDRLRGQNVSNGGLVALDPKTGEILAMVGSKDWSNDAIGGKYNIAVAHRQPGSALKPFTYLAGFQKGMTAATVMHDKKTNFGGNPPFIPQNYDKKYRGNVPARQALQNSLNVPAVEALRFVGLPDFLDLLHHSGVTTLNGSLSDYGLALTLGGGEVKLLDLTSSYGTLAAGGLRQEPRAITKIINRDGKTIKDETVPRAGERIISEQFAYLISHVLSDDNARSAVFGRGGPLQLGERPAAAKTGTTDDYRDAWAFGYTPSLVVGTWVGNNNNAAMGQVAGALGAAPIWQGFMNEALAATPIEQFARPGGIIERCVNRGSGLPLPDGANCSPTDREIFVEGVNPVMLPDTSMKERPKEEPKKDEPKPEEEKQPEPEPALPQGRDEKEDRRGRDKD
jgi:1A family penicillin-binding protein